MNKRYSISSILPVYNEEGNVEKVIKELSFFFYNSDKFNDYEIIVVDDGSKDKTGRILERLSRKIPNLKIITHSKNRGYGQALISGFTAGRFSFCFFMDADGQFDIRDLDKLFFYISQYDIVIGYRERRRDPAYRIALGKVYTLLIFLLFGLKVKDINCGFKLFKREVLDVGNVTCGGGAYYAEFLIKAKNKGCKIKEVSVKHFSRLKGRQTGANPKVVFNAVVDLVRLGSCLVKRNFRG